MPLARKDRDSSTPSGRGIFLIPHRLTGYMPLGAAMQRRGGRTRGHARKDRDSSTPSGRGTLLIPRRLAGHPAADGCGVRPARPRSRTRDIMKHALHPDDVKRWPMSTKRVHRVLTGATTITTGVMPLRGLGASPVMRAKRAEPLGPTHHAPSWSPGDPDLAAHPNANPAPSKASRTDASCAALVARRSPSWQHTRTPTPPDGMRWRFAKRRTG